MVMKTRKKEPSILDEVRKELKEEEDGELDEEYNPDEDRNNLGSLLSLGEGRKPRGPDEIAIDEMLIGVEGSDWYLKLSKETSPNVWQFKRRIDQFRHWADMELQINLLVQKETANEVKRRGKVVSWGSGRYMVTFFSDHGVGSNKKKPVFFDVDAQEPDSMPPTTQTAEMLDVLRETITSPKDVIQQNVESMQKGMELAAMASSKSGAGDNSLMAMMMNQQNNSTQLIVGMMTAMMSAMGGKNGDKDPLDFMRGMIGTMKDAGAFPAARTDTQSLGDQILMFKTLGLIKDPGDSDPLNMFTKMKGILGMVQELTGAGPAERPSIVEKIVETVGPHVGKLIEAVSNISAMRASAAQLALTGPAQQQAPGRPIIIQQPPAQQLSGPKVAPGPPMNPTRGPVSLPQAKPMYNTWDDVNDGFPSGPVNMPDLPPESYAVAEAERVAQQVANGQMPVKSYQEAPMPAVQVQDNAAIAQELYQAIMQRDYSKFPRITQMMDGFFGPGVMRAQILSGQTDVKGLVNYVTIFDRKSYTTQQAYLALQDYAYKYIESVRTQSKPNETIKPVLAKCQACGNIHEFDSMQQWNDEAGENAGNVTCGINGCQGLLALEG